MKLATFLKRVDSKVNQTVTYKLGAGGNVTSPTAPVVNSKNQADCTGYFWGCLGISRKINHPLYKKVNGGWGDTTAIHRDINEATGYFRKIPKPIVGAVGVKPDKNGGQGHIVIARQIKADGTVMIVDCSSSNPKGKAVQLRPLPSSMKGKDVVWGWCEHIEA